MRLALDHHYSPVIAQQLRARGHDVVAAVELGWHTLDDETLLRCCQDDRRALLTNNVADFAVLARSRSEAGLDHHGLVFTSDSAWPRARSTIGRFVEALDRLLAAHAGDDAFVDQVHWL